MLDVLIDMTALNTPSRERGIGRYVRNLCLALAVREAWPSEPAASSGRGLSIEGLVRNRGALAGAV
ncbi:MAG TPA: hypothetical protein VGF76_07790, partial [Polyangiaceae bacterium]